MTMGGKKLKLCQISDFYRKQTNKKKSTVILFRYSGIVLYTTEISVYISISPYPWPPSLQPWILTEVLFFSSYLAAPSSSSFVQQICYCPPWTCPNHLSLSSQPSQSELSLCCTLFYSGSSRLLPTLTDSKMSFVLFFYFIMKWGQAHKIKAAEAPKLARRFSTALCWLVHRINGWQLLCARLVLSYIYHACSGSMSLYWDSWTKKHEIVCPSFCGTALSHVSVTTVYFLILLQAAAR